MDEEIKTGEMTGEIDESITVEEDFTLLEGKAVSITDDSDNKTSEDEAYEEALEIKESLDDIRQQIKDKLLDILEKGKITDADGCEIELLNDQYTEKYNELKDVANSVLPGGTSASTNTSTTEVVKVNIDYDEILKTINEKADWLYIDEDGTVMLNGEVVPKLKVMELEAEKIKADVGEFKNLTTENFTAINAKIDNLEVTDLTAVNADITNLKALVAEIQTLVGGNLTMDNIQSLVLTSDKVTIANALIKNAMIDSISANKITTGTINTNNVNIQSADGSMIINGTTQQFKDSSGKVRIQIGKDAQGNFTFALFSQDGVGVLIDESGIKSGAVPNGIIVNDMVADNANISGGKLDISSVISSINDNVNTLKSSKIKFDDTNQTLDIAFNQLKSKVETIENITVDGDLSSVMEQVTTNTTNIGVMQGQISSLISNTTITKQDGTVVQLKDEFNSVKDTVDSHTRTINSLETNYKATLKSSSTQYYVSTSATEVVGGSWSDTSPTWTAGKYIWQRMKYTYTDNSVKYSTAVCIQGAKGEQGSTGAKGQSLTKSTPQWYASTSNTTQTGGSWVESMPSIDSSHYLWLRYKLDWANPTATTYTTPTLEQIAESIKEVSAKQSEFQQDLDGFKWTVSNTYQTIDGMNDYATKSQLQQTATDLTATFNNGYTQGVTQMNADGIKVYHNQIDGENYTHIAPSGFWIKYKGEDIFICDQNGLTYKGTITGSTITGGTIKGTEVIGGSLNVEGVLTAGKLVCEDIDSPKYPGVVVENMYFIISESGDDDSELVNWATFKTFDGLLDKLPKNLNGHEVHIEMRSNITENVEFNGFHGGKIMLYMKGYTLYGYVVSKMGSVRINIYSGYIGDSTNESNGWGKIHPSKGYAVSTYTATVASSDQGCIALYNIDVYGADNYLSGSTTKLGVASQDFGAVYLKGVSYYGCDIGARANAGGRIHDVLSYNVCTKYGFYATTGGYITLAGSEHSGGKSKNYHEADAGKVIVASGATFAGGEASVPGGSAPVVTTKTVTIKSKSGDTYRSSVYNNYKGDNTVRQGDYGYGDCNGIWLFGDQFDQFKGKNITKVVITISRQEGGNHSAVDLNIKTHNYKTKPSGKPSYVGTVGTLGLAVNTTDKKTITDTSNAIITGLKAGTIKGIGLQSTYDSSHYAVCSGSVTVKITYTE